MKRKEEAPAQGADTVKEWMEAHPQEYAQFAARMKTEGIGGVLKLGEDAFRLSPDFQQEVERMVTTGRFDVSSLLEHRHCRSLLKTTRGKRMRTTWPWPPG